VEARRHPEAAVLHPPRRRRLITFAGLYEWWRDPDQPEDSADRWLLTCSIITTAATGPQAKIHTRMPAFLAPEHHAAWLDPEASKTDLLALLDQAPPAVSERLDVYPVSTEVNNARNQGVQLIARTDTT